MLYDQNTNQNPDPRENRSNYESPNFYETPSTPNETPNTPYGASNTPYGDPNTPYGAGIPPRSPLPLEAAIRDLPNQYARVITKPGTATFAAEQGKAAWNIVWVQLIILAILNGLAVFIGFNSPSHNVFDPGNTAATSQQALEILHSYSGAFAISMLIFTPIGFFISTGLYHLIAKAFGGRGTYLAYCYSYLLIGIPIAILSEILSLIPTIGAPLVLVPGIYHTVLLIFMTMVVHRLTGGKATLAVLIIPIAIVVLFVVGIISTAVMIGAMHAH